MQPKFIQKLNQFLCEIAILEKRAETLNPRIVEQLSRWTGNAPATIQEITQRVNLGHGEYFTTDEVLYVLNAMKWAGRATVTHGENIWSIVREKEPLTA